MSEYATPTNTTNPVLNPLTYWRVSAFALAAAAVLGIIVNAVAGNHTGIEGFLVFDWVHNILHGVLAAAAFVFGFAKLPGNIVKAFAIVFGFIYGGLGVMGLALGMESTLFGILHVQLGTNLIHTLLGVWALATGFTARY